MNNFVDYFKSEYYQKLLTPGNGGQNPVRNRADSLLLVFQLLGNMNNPMIVETGCMRPDHGDLCYGDDGCSTKIFDDYLLKNGGTGFSIEKNPINCEYAEKICSFMRIICADSVEGLYCIPSWVRINLLYLDSYDIDVSNPHLANLHALKELSAAMPHLYPGSLIVVDDYIIPHMPDCSKGRYVKDFLENVNAEILYEGYQLVAQLR